MAIGGWAKKPVLSNWEGRLLQLHSLGVNREAVLQAHVPFLDPTVPRREELRNQFWWALAGDARGYYIETAYLFTHFSVRGLLSWDLKPLPDGRFEEVRELAAATRQLEDMLLGSRRATGEETVASKVVLAPTKQPIAFRLRAADAGGWYVLLINEDLTRPTTAVVTLAGTETVYQVTDVLANKDRGLLDGTRQMRVEIPAGGGACLRLTSRGK